MYRRRLTVLIILAVVGLLGLLLFVNVRPSTLFRIGAPTPESTSAQSLANLKNSVSPSLITGVSTTTLLQRPRYTGRDAAGRNWLVSALSAGQEGTTTSGTYILNNVQATWEDPSQTVPFVLSATQGRYTQVSSTLDLTGDVSATAVGFNLTAPRIQTSLTSRTLQTTGGSRVTGSLTGAGGKSGWHVNITAPVLNADQLANRLLLTGGVHAILTPTKN